MRDEHLRRLELVEPRRAADGAARLVHECLRLQQRDLVPVEADLGDLAGELRLPRAAVPASELVDHEVADVVAASRPVQAPGAPTPPPPTSTAPPPAWAPPPTRLSPPGPPP